MKYIQEFHDWIVFEILFIMIPDVFLGKDSMETCGLFWQADSLVVVKINPDESFRRGAIQRIKSPKKACDYSYLARTDLYRSLFLS
jgi:hypothetical protein